MPSAKKKPAKAAAAPAASEPAAPNLSYIAEGLRPLAVPIDTVFPDPANTNKHGDGNIAAIKASLARFGQRQVIAVNRRTGNTIEAGNGRLIAAKELGWTHIAVLFVDDDPTTALGYSISDNRTAELAEWDLERLAASAGILRDEDAALLDALALDELLPQDEALDASQASAEPIAERYQIVVTVASAAEQETLFEDLQKRGYKCRPLTI